MTHLLFHKTPNSVSSEPGAAQPVVSRSRVRFGVTRRPDRSELTLPLCPRNRTLVGHRAKSEKCRYCCKSRKLHPNFRRNVENAKRSMVRITSAPLSKSPMSLAGDDEVPQISTRKPRLRPLEFLTPSAKRLLQHYLPTSDIARRMTRGIA